MSGRADGSRPRSSLLSSPRRPERKRHRPRVSIRQRLRHLARTTAAVLLVVAVFIVASSTALVVSKDPAPLVISFGALALSALQFWRVELRGPDVAVVVMDSPAIDILEPKAYNSEHYLLTVRQPVVIENVGGHPCALSKFRIPSDLIKVSGWSEEHLVIEEEIGGPWERPKPMSLVPREPVLFTAAWSLKVSRRPIDGKPLDLRRRLSKSGLAEPSRHAALAYSESGATVEKLIRIEMNREVLRDAAEQLVLVSEGGEATTRIDSPDPVHIDFTDVPDKQPQEQ
jgi:hypothetical protein